MTVPKNYDVFFECDAFFLQLILGKALPIPSNMLALQHAVDLGKNVRSASERILYCLPMRT